MNYAIVDPRLWDDERVASLSVEGKLVWLFVLTGPQALNVPGLMVGGTGTIAEGLRLPIERVVAAFSELQQAGLLEFDESRRLIRVPKAPKYNPPHNGNVIKGWYRYWKILPESPLKYRHLFSLKSAIESAKDSIREMWAQTFGTIQHANGSETVPQTVTRTVSKPFANGLPIDPVTVSASDPDPDPDPDARSHVAPTPAQRFQAAWQDVTQLPAYGYDLGEHWAVLEKAAELAQAEPEKHARDLLRGFMSWRKRLEADGLHPPLVSPEVFVKKLGFAADELAKLKKPKPQNNRAPPALPDPADCPEPGVAGKAIERELFGES